MYDFNEALKKTVLEQIAKINLDPIIFRHHAKEHSKTLRGLCTRKIINNDSVESALEQAVFSQAKKEYNILTRKDNLKLASIKDRVKYSIEHKDETPYPIWADHIMRPDCLAYALDKKVFSEKEVSKIPFDHGHDAEKYVKFYSEKNLLSKLRNDLLFPKREKKYDLSDSGSHCCCSC